MEIEYVEKLDKNTIKVLDSEFRKYAVDNGTNSNYKFCNFVAKEKSKIVGVLKGHSNYDEAIIDDLIVFEGYRGRDVGTQLIRQFEDYNKNKNFRYISVMTYEFQAPKFYEKLGFKLEFKRENKENPKLTRYYFIKYF